MTTAMATAHGGDGITCPALGIAELKVRFRCDDPRFSHVAAGGDRWRRGDCRCRDLGRGSRFSARRAVLRACVRSGRGDGFLERSADQHPKMKETTMSATRSVRRSGNTTVSSPQRGATVPRHSARAMTRGKGLASS